MLYFFEENSYFEYLKQTPQYNLCKNFNFDFVTQAIRFILPKFFIIYFL